MTAKGTPPAGTARLDQIGDRYTVEREIGRGGMATVYLCTDSRDGGKVAVKVLRPELGSAVVVERFLREIAFASELDHPQIPKVLDSGVVGELPFYVMNYIEGESLRARLDRERQLPIEEAIRITQEIVKPTAYAHARGIVHRDIKPGNILLSKDLVYVLDFGVARAIMASADESLTSTGVAVGTPAYMSPEQALADHHVDARSDIYSLGCVVYEMIAGIPPFMGATAQAVMSRRFIAPPPPLHEARDSVPSAVESAVMKALTRSPADRWQTASAFGDALTGAATSPSVQAYQETLAGRKRKIAIAIAAVAVIAVIGTGLAAWSFASRDRLSRGLALLDEWKIAAAEKELAKAVQDNPGRADARLWMGQLLAIKGAPSSAWAPYVLKALDDEQHLQPFDRLRAEALAAYSREHSPERCTALRRLVAQRDAARPGDFTASLNLADCLVADSTVVPDTASPSGYRFTSSYHEAASLYEGLLDRNAGNGQAYSVLIPRLEEVLWTSKNRVRIGDMHGEQPMSFVASPTLAADTASFVPWPVPRHGEPMRSDAQGVTRHVERNLDRLLKLATAWTRAAPNDADASEMLASILESKGRLDGNEGGAIATIRRARVLPRSEDASPGDAFDRKLRLATSNVRLFVKAHEFRSARILADSAIGWSIPSDLADDTRVTVDELRSGLCALTGRLSCVITGEQKYSAEYRVRAAGETRKLSADLGADVVRLSAYAAFGAPVDSIMSHYRRIMGNLESFVAPAQLAAFRSAVLQRPLSLAVDVTGTAPLASLGTNSGMFARAVAALDAGNRERARRLSDSLSAFRAGMAPGEITMDVVLQEAWLRATLGDKTGAAQSLDRALRGLSRAPPNLLKGAPLATALVRAMKMRAQLAREAGDSAVERQWTDSAQELWRGADEAVRSSLTR